MAGVLLRYFDCRGRAQPLRNFLGHHGVAFSDERVRFDDGYVAWAKLKCDPALSGPFGKLPVLEWDGRLLAETSPIAIFLQDQLDPTPKAMQIRQLHSALSEELGPLYELLNLDLLAPGADARAVARRVSSGLTASLRRYELMAGGPDDVFRTSAGFSICAFWLKEVTDLARVLLTTSDEDPTEGLPGLSRVLSELAALPAVANAQAPAFWSARPDEAERLQALASDLR